MKNKLKFLLSLFLCLSLTSCNNKVFMGNDKVYIAPKTVLGVEYSRSGYDANNVELDVYVGFSDVKFDYDLVYGIYLTNSVSFQNNNEWIEQGTCTLNLPGHQLIASFTEHEALTQYSFDVKNHRIVYNDSIKVKADSSHFYKVNNIKITQGSLKLLAVTFTKKIDGCYWNVVGFPCNSFCKHLLEVAKQYWF